ncbi:MAG: hypothetical protein C3F02_03465, partial [Parcubacteria group bacterium]
MYAVFLLLFLICPIVMVVGLIKPSIFNKMFKGYASRKRVFLTFSLATLVLFIAAGISAPKDLSSRTNNITKELQGTVFLD